MGCHSHTAWLVLLAGSPLHPGTPELRASPARGVAPSLGTRSAALPPATPWTLSTHSFARTAHFAG